MKIFHILMIIFILPSCSEIRGILYSQMGNDLDVTQCNYGKHQRDILNWCDCKNVLGNGPHCEIKKLFNSTHIQVIFAIVPDQLDSWLKNLEIQFTKEIITIVEETKYDVYGYVNNSIYFGLQLSQNIIDKQYFTMPRSILKMIKRIFSKEVEIKTVSTKEEIRKNNETKVVKNDCSGDHITRIFLIFILAFMILGFRKEYLKDIKKFICLPIRNRSTKHLKEFKKRITRKAMCTFCGKKSLIQEFVREKMSIQKTDSETQTLLCTPNYRFSSFRKNNFQEEEIYKLISAVENLVQLCFPSDQNLFSHYMEEEPSMWMESFKTRQFPCLQSVTRIIPESESESI